MRDMESVRDIMTELETCSNLIADAIIRKTTPVEDDISEHQAKKAYGVRWIVKMRRYGLAEAHRVGGRILYSRHQLNCLREAERQHDEIFLSKRKKLAPGG